MSGISAHMIVKNEDRWVWFSITSVLPYVDEFLITDTGSTDNTLDIIKSINSPKIKLSLTKVSTSAEVTKARQSQLEQATSDWIWIVDADEIYPDALAKECSIATKNAELEGILVRRYDLLGDIYHRQTEDVGTYNLFGQSGHLLIRLLNLKKLKKLSYRGDYPNEGFFDAKGESILTHDPGSWYNTTKYLYHSMYLKRSSLGSNLPMFNRGKYKIENGIKINDSLPEVFNLNYPTIVPNPLQKRSLGYEILAKLITPIKKLKRNIT